MKKILFIGRINPELKSALLDRGIEYMETTPREINVILDSNEISVFCRGYKLSYGEFDGVWVLRASDPTVLRPIVYALSKIGIKSLRNLDTLYDVQSKVMSALKVSNNGILIPTQVSELVDSSDLFRVKVPAVIKVADGSLGKGVLICKQRSDVTQISEFMCTCLEHKKNVIVQEYIESRNSDERYIVLNGKVISAMERSSTDESEFRANLSLGGSGKPIECTPEVEELCAKIMKCFPGEVYAGIDIIKGTDGKRYFIEINNWPGTKIISVTGKNHFYDLADYFLSLKN